MGLWFDVGKETYTTTAKFKAICTTLWFDVGKETYTTLTFYSVDTLQLWFDVGKETIGSRDSLIRFSNKVLDHGTLSDPLLKQSAHRNPFVRFESMIKPIE